MAFSDVQLQAPSSVFIPGNAKAADIRDHANDVEATAGLSRPMEAEPQITLLRRQGRPGPSAGSEESHRASTTRSTLRDGQHEGKAKRKQGSKRIQKAYKFPGKSLWSSARGWTSSLDSVKKLPATIFLPPPKKTPSVKYEKELKKINHFKLQDHTNGIPRFAALQDSNESWCFFRTFGPQAARILQRKEIELDRLAKEIQKEEEKEGKVYHAKPRFQTLEEKLVLDSTKIAIEDEFENKLKDYYDLLNTYTGIKSLRSVREEDHQSVHNYIIRNRPFSAAEEAFFYEIDDFVYAKRGSGAATGYAGNFEEKVTGFAARRPTTLLRSCLHNFLKDEKEQKKTEKHPNVHNFSPTRVAIVCKLIAATSAVAVILIPVAVLYLTISLSSVLRVTVVCIFVFVFLVTVSILGDWEAHELFLLMAAYAAILVALLSNLGQGITSSSISE